MPTRCVVGGCSNVRNLQEDIALHTIQFYVGDRPKSKKRMKRWVNFVKFKRSKREPSKTSVIYSKHYKADDFVWHLDVSSKEQWTMMTPWLKRDDYGINVFPSIHASTIVEACKMGFTSLHDSFGSWHYTFALLCSVIQQFLSLCLCS